MMSFEDRRCPNCGFEYREGQQFCTNCGTPVNINRGNVSVDTRYANSAGYAPKSNSKNAGLYALIAVLVALIIGITVFFSYMILKDSDEIAKMPPKDEISPMINSYISNNYLYGDVSVAIYDNKNDLYYMSDGANQMYTAWGLYLPVYLTYKDYTYHNVEILEGILSNNISVCNRSANTAIKELGGFQAINSAISSKFDTQKTNYGRYFADVNSVYENYTSAFDAVRFIEEFNKTDYFGNLSYDIGYFGISAPAGVSVYAHVGTENNSIREEMNLFAVVKGQNSDYCIAILTQNNSSYEISRLLNVIHNAMENIE